MSDIKQVIGLLCKQLNFLLNTTLKPEYFRLAKFNRTDSNIVEIFWDLLNLLANKSNGNHIQIEQIKTYFKSIDYHNPDFHQLPDDMSGGSRELLIAFAYFICKHFGRMISDEVKLSPFNPEFNLIQLRAPAQLIHEIPLERLGNNCTNYVKWISGQIERNMKTTREYTEHNVKLFCKINHHSFKDLSVNEMLALNDEHFCKIFMDKSDRVMQILRYYQKWLTKEHVFWKWMDTVLAEKGGD